MVVDRCGRAEGAGSGVVVKWWTVVERVERGGSGVDVVGCRELTRWGRENAEVNWCSSETVVSEVEVRVVAEMGEVAEVEMVEMGVVTEVVREAVESGRKSSV